MATLVSFPSGYTRVKHVLLLADQKRIRTINDHRDLVINTDHLFVDSMRGLQNLCSYYPDLFVGQLVQSLQRIFDVSLSNQLLQVFF